MTSAKISCISGSLPSLGSIVSSLKLGERELVVVQLLIEQSEFFRIEGGVQKVCSLYRVTWLYGGSFVWLC